MERFRIAEAYPDQECAAYGDKRMVLGSRKKDNLKPLSEKDIQEKLYGRLRTGTNGRAGDFVLEEGARPHGELFAEVKSLEEEVESVGSVKESVGSKEGNKDTKEDAAVPKTPKEGFIAALSRFASFSSTLSERDIQQKLYGYCNSAKSAEFDGKTVKSDDAEESNEKGETVKPACDDMATDAHRKEDAIGTVKNLFQEPQPVISAPPQKGIEGFFQVPEKPAVAMESSEILRQRQLKPDVMRGVSRGFNLGPIKLPEGFRKIPVSTILGALAAAIVIFVTFRVLVQWSSGLMTDAPSREVVAPAQSATGGLLADTQPVLKETVVQATPVQGEKTATIAKKFYTIQLVVYEDAGMAEKLVAELKKKKLDAFTRETTLRRGRQYNEVFVGHFATSQEADKKLAEYRKKNLVKDFPDSFIRPRFE